MLRKGIPRLSSAEWALVAVTMIWGATFLIIRNALSTTGPLFFVGVRFGSAAIVMAILSRGVLKGITVREVCAGAAIGASLFAGYALQTFGLQSITASKSAFITAFYVPMVPIFQWLIMRRPPGVMAWLGIVFAFFGVVLLAGPEGASLGFGEGELLTFIGAVAVALEIVLISYFAGDVNLWRVTVVQVAVASLLSFACIPAMSEGVPSFSWVFVVSACGLGLASAIIQLVMNWAQKNISPTRATVIYAGEPIWGGAFGWLAGERLPLSGILGGALIVIGVLVSDLKRKDGK